MVSDAFQNSFYESLLQKSIENYDKAITALEKCLNSQPNNAVIHFELGKNYLALKQYDNAYKSFDKATQIDPSNRWFWVGKYDVSFQTKNYLQAIETVERLIVFDEMYKDDLIPLYIATQKPDKALAIIAEMNAKYGKSQERTQFKNKILLADKNQSTGFQEFDQYKKQLDTKETPKAIESLKNILNNPQTELKLKLRVWNEWLNYASENSGIATEIDSLLETFEDQKNLFLAKETAQFFRAKKKKELAVKFIELAQTKDPENVETNVLLLQIYAETKQFQKIETSTSKLLELFPAQAVFYYYSGLAFNQLQQYKKAKDSLETGIDFVIDDNNLEINFYLQMAEAYNGLKDFNKKEYYFSRANQLIKDKKQN